MIEDPMLEIPSLLERFPLYWKGVHGWGWGGAICGSYVLKIGSKRFCWDVGMHYLQWFTVKVVMSFELSAPGDNDVH